MAQARTVSGRYEHTQRSPGLLLLLCGAGAVTLALLIVHPSTRDLPLGPRLTILAASMAMIGAGVLLSALTITVDDERLEWRFGGGVFHKTVPHAEIASAETTTASWLNGIGVHLTSRGWLYNVGGRGAVLVTLRDGTRFLLGTDEPDALVRALQS